VVDRDNPPAEGEPDSCQLEVDPGIRRRQAQCLVAGFERGLVPIPPGMAGRDVDEAPDVARRERAIGERVELGRVVHDLRVPGEQSIVLACGLVPAGGSVDADDRGMDLGAIGRRAQRVLDDFGGRPATTRLGQSLRHPEQLVDIGRSGRVLEPSRETTRRRVHTRIGHRASGSSSTSSAFWT
jgi:hypothetical protein